RHGADGQAPVRGRSGEPRQERRRARPDAPRRGRPRGRRRGLGGRLGHSRSGAQSAARTGGERRVLLLAEVRCPCSSTRRRRGRGRGRSAQRRPPGRRPTVRRVLLTVHTARDGAPKIAADFAASLQEAGIEVRAIADEIDSLEAAGATDLVSVPAEPGAAADCELTVVFGGDGTILRAAELCRGTGTPLLGVNLGHVGFLAEADEEDLDHVAQCVIAGGLSVEERLTIDVTVLRDGEVVATNWALNEASVEKAARERMLEVVVEIDGRPVSRMGCDGIVCATPTGSTAY